MKRYGKTPLVMTISERCRVCYTCVRECPAKAIRIADGQAEVLPERCIGCGNCVRVCSQKAKKVLGGLEGVRGRLARKERLAACFAPSFPAEFTEVDYRTLVGMTRRAGFGLVVEVGFGADLVADRYRRLLSTDDDRQHIATTCPAIIGYVEKYLPHLVDHLAPIVSPMVATARALRRLQGEDLRVVFIGPCIAKKGERPDESGPSEVDEVLTFTEFRQLLDEARITPAGVEASDFDPPRAAAGALLGVSRGLLQAANLREDLVFGQVIAAEGTQGFVEALREFELGHLEARLLEVICCTGCIMGAGMRGGQSLFSRRRRISEYVRRRIAEQTDTEWRSQIEEFEDLDLSRTFEPDDQRIAVPFEEEITQIMSRMGKFRPEDELNCGACGYDTCREHAVAIFKGLAESEMCLPFIIEQLRRTVGELAQSNDQLLTAQEALMHAERLASMGQLAAGIAHEVNNPLGVVLMYAHLLLEEAAEHPGMHDDLHMIVEQADRCKTIVAGLLNFARQNKVILQPTDLGELVDRSLRGLQAPENIRVKVEHAQDDPVADLDGEQIVQVLTNLLSNAVAAMPQGGTLTVRTEGDGRDVRLIVRDTGVGIPPENLAKIFEPFFTTKQIGKGTGLGLAVAYGVVKMHRGEIQVQSNTVQTDGPTGTAFIVTLPRRAPRD